MTDKRDATAGGEIKLFRTEEDAEMFDFINFLAEEDERSRRAQPVMGSILHGLEDTRIDPVQLRLDQLEAKP